MWVGGLPGLTDSLSLTICKTRERPPLDVQGGHGQDSPNGKKKHVTKKDTRVDLSQGRGHVGIT